MNRFAFSAAIVLSLAAASSFAQAPAGAPAGSTALCKDGSYFSGATKKGACKGHKGVKDWFGGDESAAAKPDAKQSQADEKAAKAKAKEEAKEAKAKAKEEAKAAKNAPTAAAPVAAPVAPVVPAAPSAPAAKAAPAAVVAPATPAPQAASIAKPASSPAAGGGPGKVWVNASTKVYHCPGSRWYGTTKQGEYMSESEAQSKGIHADHGKTCGS